MFPDVYTKAQDYLYSRRIILINGEINEETADFFMTVFTSLMLNNEEREPIKIFINSEGGDLTQAFAVHDLMVSSLCPVHTIGLGLVCSAATLLLAAGDKGSRYVYPNTELMIHQVSGGIFDKVSETLNYAKELEALNVNLAKLYSKYTGKSMAKVKKDLESDKYLTAIEAVKYGLADQVIENNSASTGKARSTKK